MADILAMKARVHEVRATCRLYARHDPRFFICIMHSPFAKYICYIFGGRSRAVATDYLFVVDIPKDPGEPLQPFVRYLPMSHLKRQLWRLMP